MLFANLAAGGHHAAGAGLDHLGEGVRLPV
jgi:hypothetical protein